MSEAPTVRLVHEDSRGEMYVIPIDGQELMLIHSKAGSMRGGHSHEIPEAVLLLTGEMKHYKRYASGTEHMQRLSAGDSYFNRPGEVHMGEFLKDSWLVEWRLGADRSNTDYKPWRDMVKANVDAFAR